MGSPFAIRACDRIEKMPPYLTPIAGAIDPDDVRRCVERVFAIERVTLETDQAYVARFHGRLNSFSWSSDTGVGDRLALAGRGAAESGVHTALSARTGRAGRDRGAGRDSAFGLACLAELVVVGADRGQHDDVGRAQRMARQSTRCGHRRDRRRIAAIAGDPIALTLAGLEHMLLGWPFMISMIAILGAHELGHYIAARLHREPVSPPYFIPLPFSLLGTMGAVINLKAPPANRKVLLDIGAAGPIAGLVVAIRPRRCDPSVAHRPGHLCAVAGTATRSGHWVRGQLDPVCVAQVGGLREVLARAGVVRRVSRVADHVALLRRWHFSTRRRNRCLPQSGRLGRLGRSACDEPQPDVCL